MTGSPSGERTLAIVVAECATLFRPTLASELRQDHEVGIRVQSENCGNGENGGPGRCERNWREAS